MASWLKSRPEVETVNN